MQVPSFQQTNRFPRSNAQLLGQIAQAALTLAEQLVQLGQLLLEASLLSLTHLCYFLADHQQLEPS